MSLTFSCQLKWALVLTSEWLSPGSAGPSCRGSRRLPAGDRSRTRRGLTPLISLEEVWKCVMQKWADGEAVRVCERESFTWVDVCVLCLCLGEAAGCKCRILRSYSFLFALAPVPALFTLPPATQRSTGERRGQGGSFRQI